MFIFISFYFFLMNYVLAIMDFDILIGIIYISMYKNMLSYIAMSCLCEYQSPRHCQAMLLKPKLVTKLQVVAVYEAIIVIFFFFACNCNLPRGLKFIKGLHK